jgi:hypothetical protein
MTWLDELARNGFDDPAGVITDVVTEEVKVGGERAGKITLQFRVRNMRGEPYVATGKVYLPETLAEDASQRLPTWFNCHYEIEEPTATRQLSQGRVVFSPVTTDAAGTNPFLRTVNADYVLAHLARGARFVEPTAIAYGGGSAGGQAALMVAAEAFPATVVAALGPPVNLGYEHAYMGTVYPRFVADPPEGFPVIQMITQMFALAVAPATAAYGDPGSRGPFDNSPVAHVDRITCRAFVMTSTADFLVPVEQFSREFAQATIDNPPKHVTIAAEELNDSPLVSVRLADVLGERADVRRIPLPEGAPNLEKLDLTMQRPKSVPVEVADEPADGKQWLVNFLDEGPIVLGATHGRYGVEADFEPFVCKALERGIDVEQLTAVKLDQLIDRFTGQEWMAQGFCHLDEPEAERADVVRGLALYCSQSDAHAERFAALYAELDESRRVLPDF